MLTDGFRRGKRLRPPHPQRGREPVLHDAVHVRALRAGGRGALRRAPGDPRPPAAGRRPDPFDRILATRIAWPASSSSIEEAANGPGSGTAAFIGIREGRLTITPFEDLPRMMDGPREPAAEGAVVAGARTDRAAPRLPRPGYDRAHGVARPVRRRRRAAEPEPRSPGAGAGGYTRPGLPGRWPRTTRRTAGRRLAGRAVAAEPAAADPRRAPSATPGSGVSGEPGSGATGCCTGSGGRHGRRCSPPTSARPPRRGEDDRGRRRPRANASSARREPPRPSIIRTSARCTRSARTGAATHIAMELLAGETLAARLARGPLPLTEAIAIARGSSRRSRRAALARHRPPRSQAVERFRHARTA